MRTKLCLSVGIGIFLLSACQNDGYMGRGCEAKGFQKGTPEFQACVDEEERRNTYQLNKYRDGGP